MNERGLRLNVVQAARRLSELGLNSGRAGNLSVRVDGGFVVTPSGAAYESMHPDDLVYLTSSGDFGGGQRTPSSEWRIHRDIYARRQDAKAVVHTHSPFATTLACLHRGIPAFHYEVAFAGGSDIRCSPYATFGTQDLSVHADRPAVRSLHAGDGIDDAGLSGARRTEQAHHRRVHGKLHVECEATDALGNVNVDHRDGPAKRGA